MIDFEIHIKKHEQLTEACNSDIEILLKEPDDPSKHEENTLNELSGQQREYVSINSIELEAHNSNAHTNLPEKEENIIQAEKESPTISDLEHKVPYKCHKCQVTTKTNSELEQHLQLKHQSMTINIDFNDQQVISCNFCEFKCNLNMLLIIYYLSNFTFKLF